MADYKNQELLVDRKGRPIPQIWDPATGRFYPLTRDVYSDVTVKNFPEKQFVEDVSVKARLEQVKAELEDIKTKLNGTINTQLTGSNIEELVPVNSVAFTDTEGRYFSVDVSRYKKLYIYVRNTHDVNVSVEIRVKDALISRTWNSDTKKFETGFGLGVVLEPFAGYYLLNTQMSLLNEIITDRIAVRIQCLETPTQGSITVKIVGIPN